MRLYASCVLLRSEKRKAKHAKGKLAMREAAERKSNTPRCTDIRVAPSPPLHSSHSWLDEINQILGGLELRLGFHDHVEEDATTPIPTEADAQVFNGG
jgi:hypothetical protein